MTKDTIIKLYGQEFFDRNRDRFSIIPATYLNVEDLAEEQGLLVYSDHICISHTEYRSTLAWVVYEYFRKANGEVERCHPPIDGRETCLGYFDQRPKRIHGEPKPLEDIVKEFTVPHQDGEFALDENFFCPISMELWNRPLHERAYKASTVYDIVPDLGPRKPVTIKVDPHLDLRGQIRRLEGYKDTDHGKRRIAHAKRLLKATDI